MQKVSTDFYVVCPRSDASVYAHTLQLIAERLGVTQVDAYPKGKHRDCTTLRMIIVEAPPLFADYAIDVRMLVRKFDGAWPFHHKEVMAVHSTKVLLERLKCKK